MPIKLKETIPQLELEVATQNGETFPLCAGLGVQLHYESKSGQLFLGDSVEWMKSLPAASVDLVFADPPYNVKKADWQGRWYPNPNPQHACEALFCSLVTAV